jgi:hypothetical protein
MGLTENEPASAGALLHPKIANPKQIAVIDRLRIKNLRPR